MVPFSMTLSDLSGYYLMSNISNVVQDKRAIVTILTNLYLTLADTKSYMIYHTVLFSPANPY